MIAGKLAGREAHGPAGLALAAVVVALVVFELRPGSTGHRVTVAVGSGVADAVSSAAAVGA